jgi:peptidoglycan/xylan/chitin deacetylase (PgdA/CDA1 family)
MRYLRRSADLLFRQDTFAARFERLSDGVIPVFMLHRFADPELDVAGHDPAILREVLGFLRRNRYTIVPIGDLVSSFAQDGRSRGKTVAFTVDDGYSEFAKVAAPIFREFDSPVTVFLTTGFADGLAWAWWDQLEHVIHRTTKPSLFMVIGDAPCDYGLSTGAQRNAAVADLRERLKRVPHVTKLKLILQIADQLEVGIPSRAPAPYASMTWDEVRETSRSGVTFAPHTVTHPILRQTDERTAEREISDSWSRLRSETDAVVPVFCYPNGDPESFSEREIGLLHRLGFTAAVTSVEGYVRAAHFDSRSWQARFRLPRFAFGASVPRTVRTVTGVDRLRRAIHR